MRIRPFFRWYDIWIGAYWDRHTRTIYICPVPMFGVSIAFPRRRDSSSSTITFDDASHLYQGQILVAVNPSTGEQSKPLTVTKIGKGKKP